MPFSPPPRIIEGRLKRPPDFGLGSNAFRKDEALEPTCVLNILALIGLVGSLATRKVDPWLTMLGQYSNAFRKNGFV